MDLTNFRVSANRAGARIRAEFNEFRRKIARNDSGESRLERRDAASSVLQDDEVAELELLSESLRIDKEKVSDGELSVRKEVITELQTIQVPVTREELVIERTSADGRHTAEIFPGQRQIRIPISKERVLVQKEAVVSEVAKISRRKIRETKNVSDNVRHEVLRTERHGNVEIAEDKPEAA